MRKSINKTTVLIVLVVFLTLSVGYALFSDTITIEGTATAKGEFNITTTCSAGYSDEFIGLAKQMGISLTTDYGQKGFANSVCNVNDDTVTMTTDLLYPGARRYYIVKMINTGSIPALIWGADDGNFLESLDIDEGASWVLKNKETDELIESGSNTNILEGVSSREYFLEGTGMGVLSRTGEINSNENVIYDKNKGYAGIKLNPGDSFFVRYEFKYPTIADRFLSDNGKSEYFEFKLNHEYKWEQYVDSPNYESTTFDEWCLLGC